MQKIKILAIIMVVFLSAAACKKVEVGSEGQTVENQTIEQKETIVTEQMTNKLPVEPTVSGIDVEKKYIATIKTDKGDIVCELFAKDAPISVTNFKQLADMDYYKGLVFHRVVPDFVVQGGDPTGTGRGGPGYTIKAEIGKPHTAGALAWARTADEVNPERRSSGSQFYITYKPTPFLDGAYTVFGQTIEGMDVVNKIQQGDKILDITISEQ